MTQSIDNLRTACRRAAPGAAARPRRLHRGPVARRHCRSCARPSRRARGVAPVGVVIRWCRTPTASATGASAGTASSTRTQANFGDNPHSVHGVGWLRPWERRVAQRHRSSCCARARRRRPLAVRVRGAADLRADAEVARSCTLAFTNTAASPQPVGLGWHPYFPKRARSRLHIELQRPLGHRRATQLPMRKVAQPGIDADVAHLDFDHCFEGWQRPGAHPRREVLAAAAARRCAYLVVFTPQDKRLLLRRAGEPRQQRDPHGRSGRARPAQRCSRARRSRRR